MNEQGYTNSNNNNNEVMGSVYKNESKKNSNEDMDMSNTDMEMDNMVNKDKNTDEHGKEPDMCVLNDVYQNAVMGKQSISNIMPKAEDESFKKDLLSCYENYDEICSKASSEIMKKGEKPREKNPLSKAMLWGTINVSSIVDNSTSNLASLVIKGGHNSVNNITRTINQHSQSINENIKSIANDYIEKEQNNIENLQKYL